MVGRVLKRVRKQMQMVQRVRERPLSKQGAHGIISVALCGVHHNCRVLVCCVRFFGEVARHTKVKSCVDELTCSIGGAKPGTQMAI